METQINEEQVAAIYGGSNQPTIAVTNGGGPSGEVAEDSDHTDPADATDIAALVAQAEARGYLRGLNEAAERAMNLPDMWQIL